MEILKQLSSQLNRCGFETEIFESGTHVKSKIFDIISGHSVGHGSSMTLKSIGIIDELEKHAKTVYPHSPGNAGLDEKNALTADFYLTSANAISMQGHIINIDGTGNRVAATCFGPKKVIYVIGKNKIVKTLDDALIRAKDTAVKLAKHFDRKTPCVKTGKCEDCLSPECICSITTIHRKKPYNTDIAVFLINEKLGL